MAGVLASGEPRTVVQDNSVRRLFRVRAVAEMYDVSVSTIYRAIEAGQLAALRIGTGRDVAR